MVPTTPGSLPLTDLGSCMLQAVLGAHGVFVIIAEHVALDFHVPPSSKGVSRAFTGIVSALADTPDICHATNRSDGDNSSQFNEQHMAGMDTAG